MSFNKRNKKRERWIGKERETLLTAVQTNLQPRTMLLSKMVKSPRDSGYFDCSFSTNLVIVIKSVLFASAAWSIFPLLFFSLFSPCLSLNTLVLGSRSNSEHIYIYLKWGQRKRYARKESEWMGAEEMRWDEMRWWGYLIFISAVNGSFGGHVAGLEWREWASGHHCYADNVFRRFLFLILSFCPSFSIMQCISGYAPCDPSLTWKRTAACTSRKFISHQTRCVLFRTRSLSIFTIFLSEHIQFHR